METKKTQGFTIVELLTVMAVIAVLIGLLIPALGMVKDKAKEIQQKAQFHSINVGAELFKSDFGVYPESNDNNVDTQSSPAHTDDTNIYCGANKLAEAMVGMDYLGFHPNSDFRADGEATVTLNDNTTGDVLVYSADADTTNWETLTENIESRKGPYMELETANAFPMDEVYTDDPTAFANGPTDMEYALVLCDVYAKKRGGTGGKKTGTPILYYRARTQYFEQDLNGVAVEDDGSGVSYSEADNDIYFYQDNDALLALGMPDDGVEFTLYDVTLTTAQQDFEDMIVNEQVTTVLKPYRADSFILISAGKDGDFGTADDIFNFEKEVIE